MRTIREVTQGKLTLRLLATTTGFTGVLIRGSGGRSAMLSGKDQEEVWRRLQDEAAKADASYFGFDGARSRFLHFFPQSFETPDFAVHERDYKLAAKRKLDASLPLEVALKGEGVADLARKAYQATNFLGAIEKAKLGDALKSPVGDAFVNAAASFALGGGAAALLEMDRLMRPFECARWTVVTYLPFFWRPDAHAFLKPEVTKDFASRVGHRFAATYQPQLDYGVYESLLDLFRRTEVELADLRPRDRFDTQSFIWTVGAYRDDPVGAVPPNARDVG